ncbi:Hypothetical_protein [Hexamita inflata]|uniref:Hypothetical_protein n=1 Tax=Hexamita inflata TaxID=28002 RepID=A0AA86NDK3_9EUKA|nr:Hypothetical protein HINF_LOCUS5472 [Hexamita inflata]
MEPVQTFQLQFSKKLEHIDPNNTQILRYNNVYRTPLRKKVHNFQMYIKVIECIPNTQLVIYDKNNIQRLDGGDYYNINANTEYVLCHCLYVGDEYTLTFNNPVSFVWIPEFDEEVVQTMWYRFESYFKDIIVQRRGFQYPINVYSYNLQDISQEVQVTAPTGVVFVKQPTKQNSLDKPQLYYNPQYPEDPYLVQLHSKLVVTAIVGDCGRIKYNNMIGWVNIRYVTYFGDQGMCECLECMKGKSSQFKSFKSQVHPEKQMNSIIDDYILRQVFERYMKCDCQNCQCVRNFNVNMYESDPVKAFTKYFYKKQGQCLKNVYKDIQNILETKNIIKTTKQITQRFIKLMNDTKTQIPDSIFDQLKDLVNNKCVRNNITLDQFREILINILEEYQLNEIYNIQNVRDNIKNYFTRMPTETGLQQVQQNNDYEQISSNQQQRNAEIVDNIRKIVEELYYPSYRDLISSGFNYEALYEILDDEK